MSSTPYLQSKLYLNGGAIVLAELIDSSQLAELQAEADANRAGSQRNELGVSEVAETRGGNPSRSLAAAHGGHTQWQIFSDGRFLDALAEECGLPVSPTGGGSYSYYERPGDFLSLHRDVLTCDLTVITCLHDNGGDGGLLVYPQFSHEPLSVAARAGRNAATAVAIRTGESAALLGGVIPHEVAPMRVGQERIVSVMCYRVAGLS